MFLVLPTMLEWRCSTFSLDSRSVALFLHASLPSKTVVFRLIFPSKLPTMPRYLPYSFPSCSKMHASQRKGHPPFPVYPIFFKRTPAA